MLLIFKNRVLSFSLMTLCMAMLLNLAPVCLGQPDMNADERRAWSEMEAELAAQQAENDSSSAEKENSAAAPKAPNRSGMSAAQRAAEIARRRAERDAASRERVANSNRPTPPSRGNTTVAATKAAEIKKLRGGQAAMQLNEATGPKIEMHDTEASEAVDSGAIRLQYQDAPIGVIVRALSEKMGKPIVGGYNVEGTITFFDSRPYTLQEAFDTVNILLAMRNYRLLEDGRFLRLVPLEDTAGLPLPILRGMAQAEGMSDEKLVTILLPLKYIQASVASDLLQDMVSSFGSIVGLPKSKGVLITDRLGNIRRIGQLLQMVDTEATAEDSQMRMVELKHARARDVASVIDNIWGAKVAPRRMTYNARTKKNVASPPDPKDIVRTTYDERTNILMLTADPAKLKLAIEMVNKLDVEGGPDAGDLRIFQLKNSDAEQMATIISNMMGVARVTRGRRTPAISTTDDVRVVADAKSNRLIVSAPPESMDKIERIITEMDSESGDSDSVKVVPLKSADAAQLSVILTQATGRRDARGRVTSELTVTADPRSNTIIMTGPASDMNTAMKLIEQLDQESPDDETEVRVIRLKSGDAGQIAASLLRILNKGSVAMPRGRRGFNPMASASSSDIKIESDLSSNSLIIAAPSSEWPRIDAVLEQIQAASEPSERTTRIIPLKFADADEMAQTLSSILGGVSVPSGRSMRSSRNSRFNRRMPSLANLTGDDGITIVASSQANALLVTASPEDQQRVTDLVAQLDVEDAGSAEPITMIQLKVADAASVAQTLQEMLPPVARGQISEVMITADQRTNSVLVRAPSGDRKTIEQMIARLDTADAGGARELRIYHLKHISATEMAELIEQFYSDTSLPSINSRNMRNNRRRNIPSLSASGSSDTVKVTAAPGDKALIIEAAAEKMEQIVSLIESLDSEQQQDDPLLPRSYTLVNADASELASSLGNLFSDQARLPSNNRRNFRNNRMPQLTTSSASDPQPRFEAETRTNTLLVRATIEQYEIIETFIEKVETDARLTEATKIFKLQHARAGELVEIIRTMLTGEESQSKTRNRNWNPWGGWGRSSNNDTKNTTVRVAALKTINSIIVQGAPEKISLAEELIKQFDVSDAGVGTTIEIVKLENARAETLAEAINSTLGGRQQTTSSRNWWSPPATTSDDEDEKVTVTAEPNSNSLIIRGPAAAIPEVMEMIRSLDNSGTSNTPQIRTYRLQNNDAEELAETMGKLFNDIISQSMSSGLSSIRRSSRGRRTSSMGSSGVSFTISAETRTNSLVVSTTEAYFTMFEQLLSELEKTEVVDREVHYIQLMNADAYDIADQLDAMFADRKGPDAPDIEVDYFSNSLTIIAKDIDYRRMEPIILKVDSVSPSQVRVISAGTLRADQLAEQLRKVYPQISDNTLEIVDQLPARKPKTNINAEDIESGDVQGGISGSKASTVPADGIVGQRKPVLIAVDRYSNTLIISGSRQDLDSIDDLITQLDQGASSAEDEFRWFKIEQADVESVASTLRELFTTTSVSSGGRAGQSARRGNQNDNGDDEGSSRQRQSPQSAPRVVQQTKITVVAEPRTGHVIVKAKPTEFELIDQLVKQLDQVTTVVTELRTFPLANTNASEVVANIREILGLSAASTARTSSSSNTRNTSNNRNARTRNTRNTTALPTQLRAATVSKMLEFSSADGESVKVDASSVGLTANASTNSIVVSAPAEAMEVVAGLIQELDQSVGNLNQPVVRLYPVGTDDPVALAESLKSIFADGSASGPQRSSGSDADIIITPDAAGQVIIVSAPQAKHELIASVIEQVRQARSTAAAGEVRVYRIEYADASSVAEAISKTLSESVTTGNRRQSQTTGGSLKVAADSSSNSVVVSTTADNHDRIAELIEQLDSPPGGDYSIRAIQLENADAEQAAELLTKLFAASSGTSARGSRNSRGSSGASAVVIEGYSDSRTLLVRADDETFAKIKALATQIDTSDAGMAGVFIVPLEHAKAARMAEVVLDLYSQQVKAAGKDKVDPLAVTADERANALILGCSAQQYEKVKAWIQQVEKMSPKRGKPRMIPIKNADPEEVEDAVRKLFGDGESSSGAARPGRGPTASSASDLPFEMTVLSSQRQLLLDASDADYDAVVALIEQLDKVAGESRPDVKIFDLKFADNKKVAEALTQVFKQTARQGRQDDSVTITALANTNAVMVAGTPERIAEAAGLIEQLDTETVSPELEFRVYQLRYAKPSNIKDLLEKLLAEYKKSRTDEQMAINADDTTRSIIVTARGKVFEHVEKILKAIDVEPAVAVTEVRIVPLKRADAKTLAGVLNAMLRPSEEGQVTDEARVLQEQVKRLRIAIGKAEGDQVPELDLTRPIKISSDPGDGGDSGSNSLIVSSTPENVAALVAVIEMMDTVPVAEEATIRIFQLDHADCEVVRDLLKEVFEQSSDTLSGLDSSGTSGRARPDNATGSALVRPVNISADIRTNSLIVSGPVESIELAAEVLSQLDVDGDAVALAGRVRIIPLKNANAGAMAEMLSELFDKRYENARTDQIKRLAPVVLPELRTNSLLIVAGQDDHGVIDELLAQLDVRQTDPAVKLVVLPLKHNDAGVVGPMLQEIFEARLKSMTPSGQDPSPQDNVDIATDALINGLIISASAENLEMINQLLAKVDIEPPSVTGIVRMYQLENADAQRIAEMLESLISDGLYKPGMAAASDNAAITAREKVSIAADTRTNVLVVSASRENFAVIEEVIKRLDSSDAYSLMGAVRVYTLKRAKATDLAETLSKFFSDKRSAEENAESTGRSLAVTIVSDERTNTLLVAGGRECFAEVEAMLKQLDGERGLTGPAPKVFTLKKADATSVAETIEALYENQGGLEAAGLSVKADERTGSLVVSGDEADLARIEKLLNDLDSDKVTYVTELRVFPLRRADATELSDLLKTMLTEKPLSPVESEGQRQALLQFVRHLPGGGQLVSRALQEGILISPDTRSNSLVIAAATDSMPLLESLISAMDAIESPPAGIKIFHLENADAEKMSDVLKGMFRLEEISEGSRQASYTLVSNSGSGSAGPSVTMGSAADAYLTVTVDLRTNTILLGGADSYIAMAEQVIRELDGRNGHERATEIYRLRNVRASDIEEALTAWLDAERELRTDRLGDDAQDSGARQLEQEVTVVAVNNTSDVGEETKTSNTLLISASPRYMQTVKDMIAKLDEPQPQVQIDVLLAEVTIDDSIAMGFDWDYIADVDNAKRLLGASSFLGAQSQFGVEGSGLNLSVTGGDLSMFFQALKTEGKLEVLARPHLTIIDNQEGSLNSGERVPFVENTRVTDSGTYNTISYEDVGVILTVTPRISPDGFVRMVVAPEISSISSSSIQVGDGVTSTIFNERKITTTVSVKDGHTVVIGGLIRTQDEVNKTKIPLLGDIPYLGKLFRYDEDTSTRTELLIILTPHIINSVEESDALTRSETQKISLSPERAKEFDPNPKAGFWNYSRDEDKLAKTGADAKDEKVSSDGGKSDEPPKASDKVSDMVSDEKVSPDDSSDVTADAGKKIEIAVSAGSNSEVPADAAKPEVPTPATPATPAAPQKDAEPSPADDNIAPAVKEDRDAA